MTAVIADAAWAEQARVTREALALLGHPIGVRCLPDEPDFCGGSFALYAMSHYATLQAIVEHQMGHLGPAFSEGFEEIRFHKAAELEDDCETYR
jgi:hypothetical protein